MNDTTIETSVNDFVDNEKGFTSVDICNAIKTAGTWVRNREVAAWLRSWSPPVGYGISKVTVFVQGGTTAQAAVYLPNNMPVADYVTTSQEAMTPAAFEALHGASTVSPTATPVASVDDGDDGDDGSQSASVGAKLRDMFKWVPGS